MDVTGCRIELLGELRIVHGEHVITRFRTQKAAGLIAYLAVFLRQAHTRDSIADIFWPDREPEAARQNLTTTLTSLRRQLEAAGLPAQDVLLSDRQSVRLNPACVTTDIAEFERLLNSASKEQDLVRQETLLASAIALYRSEPLPGRYEDWALNLQSRCVERYADALDQWCVVQEATDTPEAALQSAQRAIATDPYRESPRGVHMRALAALGRPGSALDSFQQYEQLLKAEMGARPSALLQALAESVRHDPNSFERRAAGTSPPAMQEEPSIAAESRASHRAASTLVQADRLALPIQLTRFFGREQEISRLESLLDPSPTAAIAPSRTRLFTLTGPGEAGKTRLAIESARRAAPAYQGRVWFVELAHLHGPDLLPAAILNALKLPPEVTAQDAFQTLEKELGSRPCLLVLDNFEQLLGRTSRDPGAGGTDYVRLLLERALELTCLVTSRQPLHVGGEQEFPLPPLAMPNSDLENLDQLADNPGVALYTDRAILAKPDFALTPGNAASVAALCRRLEGMPLAIEMAAAWARTLPPARVLERMEHQLELLVSRRRDLPARHQSLRAAIEWSYDLLAFPQQVFLARLAVFRGGWTLEAAEAICGNQGSSVLDLLAGLQERSLVVAEQSGEEIRYRLQETVREFSSERLEASGERIEIQRRHQDFFLNLAETSEARVAGLGQADMVPRMEEERDNLREAIHFCIQDTDSLEQSFRFPVAMHHFWEARGYLAEGRRVCLALLVHPAAQARTEGRGNTLQTCFWMAFYQGEYAIGRPWIEEGLAILRETGGSVSLGNALNAMAAMLMVQKDYEGAQSCCEEAMLLWRKIGETSKICRALHNLASIASARGDTIHARALFEESVALNRQSGNWTGAAATLQVMSWMDYRQGDIESARHLGEEALRLNREIGNKTWEMFTLSSLGWVALAEGSAETAHAFCVSSLEIQKEVGSKKDLASTLECLAELAHAQQRWERAGCLWGAAEALRIAMDRPGLHTNTTTHRAKVAEDRAASGESEFQKVWNAGSALTTAQMIQYALQP